jgi:hypothetical protein
MARFHIKIAGAVAQVDSLFESTRDYCAAYLTEEPAQFALAVTREDLAYEQQALDEEARREGMRLRVFTDPFLDRAAIQRKVAEYLFSRDVLMLHGSAVAVDGRGYLFTAACGTGKSTHVRYWREVFGDRALTINDDKPFVKLTQEAVLICGAPWSGKHGLDTNVTVPLQGICILRRGSENRIAPLPAEEALPMLLHQSVLPGDRRPTDRLDALTEELARRVRLWQMDCTKDPEAARMAWQAMSETE